MLQIYLETLVPKWFLRKNRKESNQIDTTGVKDDETCTKLVECFQHVPLTTTAKAFFEWLAMAWRHLGLL